MNSVSELLRRPFLTLSLNEQHLIKQLGRPTPNLNLSNIENNDNVPNLREFDAEIYERYEWICGCHVTDALFCFPCMLFGGDALWTVEGNKDLVNLTETASIHELSSGHMHNMINNSVIQGGQDRNTLKAVQKKLIEEHNARVEKNLEVLHFLIETIKACAMCSIPLFEKSDEADEDDSIDFNKDAFLDLLKMFSEFSPNIRLFMEMELFKNDLESIKTDLIEACFELYQKEVLKEIESTDFVSFIVDDLKDNKEDLRKILILRYVVNEKPVERIWCILKYDVLDQFFQVLIAELSKVVDVNSKLISQSYKELNLSQDQGSPHSYLHLKIQMIYPNAELVHFYNHNLIDIIMSSDDFDISGRICLSQVTGICDFFTVEPWSWKLIQLFEKAVKEKADSEGRTPWNFTNDKFNTLANYRDILLDVFHSVEEDCFSYHYTVTSKAYSYSRFLEDDEKELTFWLSSFQKLFSVGDSYLQEYEARNVNDRVKQETLNIAQSSLDDVVPTASSLNLENLQVKMEEDFENENIKIEEDFETTLTKMETDGSVSTKTNVENIRKTEENNSQSSVENPSKRRKTKTSNEVIREGLMNTLLLQLQERLRFKGHITATKLVDPKNFRAFCLEFPESLIGYTLQAFPILNPVKLKAELKVLYERIDFQELDSSCELLGRMRNGCLDRSFEESVKLLRIAITIPVKIDDSDRCFSKVQTVDEYLEVTRNKKHLDILTILGCENDFVGDIFNFVKKVEEIFCAKPNREEDFKLQTLCEDQ